MSETVSVELWEGESEVLVRLDGDVDEANRKAHAIARLARGAPEVLEAVVGARSVELRLSKEASPELKDLLHSEPPVFDSEEIELVRIEVTYDGADLEEVAQRCKLTIEDVLELHSNTRYRVAFVGFMPGFAYLRGLPAELALPRRATPRTSVPAGSVAIAGEYCGIYPSATPGGWHVIGTTDAKLFDPERDHPMLLEPGMNLEFRAR
ncbi:MAG: 5-oxoprolinase subunit PxpB [Actinomycetota bacterium]